MKRDVAWKRRRVKSTGWFMFAPETNRSRAGICRLRLSLTEGYIKLSAVRDGQYFKFDALCLCSCRCQSLYFHSFCLSCWSFVFVSVFYCHVWWAVGFSGSRCRESIYRISSLYCVLFIARWQINMMMMMMSLASIVSKRSGSSIRLAQFQKPNSDGSLFTGTRKIIMQNYNKT